MSFIDTLKRSLGYEDVEGSENESSFSFSEFINDITNSVKNYRTQPQQNDNVQYEHAPKPQQAPRSVPVQDEFDDYDVITPEQSFYEIVLIF